MSEIENAGFASAGDAATADGPRDTVPAEDRCIWPGCARPRAPGRVSGSGRQKEYCLQADPPEEGGGPVHNARNRWAALRSGVDRRRPGTDFASATATGHTAGAGGDAGGPGAAGPSRPARSGQADRTGTGMGGRESTGSVPDPFVVSIAKRRSSDLLEQARRQHAAAIAALDGERELYQRLGEQLTTLADPAAADLEIAAIASRAGRDVAQSAEEAARARRGQLAAERERDEAIRLRDHADAATEQLAVDAEAAELALADRTAEFARDREVLLARAREAEDRADRARAEAASAAAAAETAVLAAKADADEVRTAADATMRSAHQEIARARGEAAEQTAAAQTRADDLVAQARRQGEEAAAEARREAVTARADAERERGAARQARAEAARTRQELQRELDDARQRIASAQADIATASAQAAGVAAQAERLTAEIERLRDELGRRDDEHVAEIVRLDAAHLAALSAERARSARAETELDALRGQLPQHGGG